MHQITLSLPSFQVGQRVITVTHHEIGLILGISFVLERSPCDLAVGWNYQIQFHPTSGIDTIPEMLLRPVEAT